MTGTAPTPGDWRTGLAVTKRWLDDRDAARASGRLAPRAVGPEVAGLYLDFIGRPRRGPVLDIGCGRGERRRHFPSGYVGLDAVAEWDDGSFPFVCGTAEHLPWPDATFDAVLSVEAFDHVLDPRMAAAEALRVLRPGGDLLIFVGTGVSDDPAEAAAHLHVFEVDALVDLFRHGLRDHRLAADGRYVALLGERADTDTADTDTAARLPNRSAAGERERR